MNYQEGTFEYLESLIRSSVAGLEKGKREKKLGDLFEVQSRHYLQVTPKYRDLLSDVWLWKDWPDRWKEKECGIDLVAKTHDGKYWAIQSKFYNPKYYITKNDVDEYLIDLNATRAAIRAGYSKNSAKQIGSRLLTNDDIKQCLDKHRRQVAKKSIVDAAWLLDHLGQIATAKISDILNDDWTYKPVSEWPLIWTQMINGLDIKQAINRNGEQVGEPVMSELRKIKTMDRGAVLEKIGKHISVQAFSERKTLVVEGRTEAIAAALERARQARDSQKTRH